MLVDPCDEFVAPFDPLDRFSEEEQEAPTGVGRWTLLHHLTIHRNLPSEAGDAAHVEAMRVALL